MCMLAAKHFRIPIIMVFHTWKWFTERMASKKSRASKESMMCTMLIRFAALKTKIFRSGKKYINCSVLEIMRTFSIDALNIKMSLPSKSLEPIFQFGWMEINRRTMGLARRSAQTGMPSDIRSTWLWWKILNALMMYSLKISMIACGWI